MMDLRRKKELKINLTINPIGSVKDLTTTRKISGEALKSRFRMIARTPDPGIITQGKAISINYLMYFPGTKK